MALSFGLLLMAVWPQRQPVEASADSGQLEFAQRQWMSLADLIRYLAEESQWAEQLEEDDDDILKRIEVELKDHLQAGLPARGRRTFRQGGGWAQGLEDIPRDFWPTSQMDSHRVLWAPSAGSTAGNRDGLAWTDVRVDADAARALWPKLLRGREIRNRYVRAMREARLGADQEADPTRNSGPTGPD